MSEMINGDLVRLVAQERLDRKDIAAIQSLVYEYSQRAVGNLLGHGGGVLAPYERTHDNDGVNFWFVPSPFAFYVGRAALTRETAGGTAVADSAWDGAVIVFDPGLASQTIKVDYTEARAFARAFVTGGGNAAAIPDGVSAMPYVWARPFLVETDNDARRQWNIALAAETPITMNTRERVRVAFTLSETTPEDDGGAPWVRIGKITAWFLDGDELPNTPYVTVISAWDNPEDHALTQEDGDWFGETANNAGMGALVLNEELGLPNAAEGLAAPGTNRDLGLIKVLHIVRNRIRRAVWHGKSDPGGTPRGAWWKLPKYSLSGLQVHVDNLLARMTSAESDLTLTESTLATLLTKASRAEPRVNIYPLAAGVLKYDKPSDTWSLLISKGLTGVVERAVPAQKNRARVVLDTSKAHIVGKRVASVHTSPMLYPVPLEIQAVYAESDLGTNIAADGGAGGLNNKVEFYIKQDSDLTLTDDTFTGAGNTFSFAFTIFGIDPTDA